MVLLAPAFLFGLLALAVPILLHLLRRRVVRTTPFPALRFLAPTRADQNRQKIRRRLVLAFRCLALALLAAAFARPFFGALPAAVGQATIVVIDNSASLQTGSRWTDLRLQALETLRSPARGDSIGLLLMNPRPTWLLPPTQDTSSALAALKTLSPGWHATRAEPALRLAADLLAANPARERRILYIGDHQANGWLGADFGKKLPPGVAVAFPEPSAPPARQAALADPALAREGDSWFATVTVRNLSPVAQNRTLSVFAENSASSSVIHLLNLSPSGTETVRLPLPAGLAQSPDYIRFALDPDALPADDTAWAVAPAARHERLVLLDRSATPAAADYVATAYAALATLPPTLRVASPPAAAWPVPAAAVLRSDTSFAGEAAARLDAFLAAGGSALVFLDGGPAQRAWLAARHVTPRPLVEAPARLRDWALDHPLVAPLAEHNLRSLVGWEFARAWSLPADAVEPLAFWADGTVALGELRVGAGRVLVAGFAPDRRDGDWPVQPAFVPFLHRAATHLLGLSATPAADAPRVGVALTLPDTSGTWRPLALPSTEPIAHHKSQIVNSSVTPALPGVYEFTEPGAPRRLYAVGLAPEESDLAPWSDGTPWLDLVSVEEARPVPRQARLAAAHAEAERQSPLWWWAFAAMAVFALAELSLANRTSR